MDIQKIKELALANGFSLKEQASGNMDLHSYVYEFANAVEQAAKAQAVPEGFVLVSVDTLEECLDWAHIAKWDSPSNEVDKKIAHHEALIESAISAQEQSQ